MPERKNFPFQKRISSAVGFLALLLTACQPATTSLPTPTITQTAPPQPTVTATIQPSPTQTSSPTPEPAWYQLVDPVLGQLKYNYALVTDPRAKVYVSLEDAVEKTGNFGYLPESPAYVAYTTSETRDGQIYYLIVYGWTEVVPYGWMAGVDLQLLTPSTFSGIQITREVPFRFGWVLADTQSTNLVGTPIQTYRRYQVVHEVPVATDRPGFITVGNDEWLPLENLALVTPGLPSDGPKGICRFIYANLKSQTLSVFDSCKLVFATLISSGKNSWTFEGNFTILHKEEYQTISPPPESTSEYYIEGVPYFMTYAGNFGFHGAYWHDEFGMAGSHGCINLSPTDARWLYDWARLGDQVVISAGD